MGPNMSPMKAITQGDPYLKSINYFTFEICFIADIILPLTLDSSWIIAASSGKSSTGIPTYLDSNCNNLSVITFQQRRTYFTLLHLKWFFLRKTSRQRYQFSVLIGDLFQDCLVLCSHKNLCSNFECFYNIGLPHVV
jgi:hypothetical protein